MLKKILLVSTVAVFALLVTAPTAKAAQKDSLIKKIKAEKVHLELKELIKKYPKIRIGKVELVKKGSDRIEVKVHHSKTDNVAAGLLSLKTAEKLVVEKTYTIKVDDKTRYFRRYWGKSSLAELTVGDKLWLVVADYGNDNYYGLAVKDNSIFWNNLRSKILDIDYEKQTFVVKRGGRKLVVHVTDRTKLIVPGVKDPSFKDLRNGQFVRVRGVVNGRLKTMDARKVKVFKIRPVLSAKATGIN